MKRFIFYQIGILLLFTLMLSSCNSGDSVKSSMTELRAPAYPLITIDPYIKCMVYG
jgi:hypothetical protein